MERSPGGVFHLHALIASTETLSEGAVRSAWRLGVADARVYDANRRAAWYLSKSLHLPDETWLRFDCSRRWPVLRDAPAA